MRESGKVFLAVLLALSGVLPPPTVLASETEARYGASALPLLLADQAAALNHLHSWKNIIAMFSKKADRKYLLSRLKADLDKPVKFQSIDRNTLVVQMGSDKVPIEFLDFNGFKVSVFKHEVTFDPADSAQVAIGKIEKRLTARSSLLLPDAQAFPIPLAASLALMVYTGALTTFATFCSLQGVNSPKQCIFDSFKMTNEFVVALAMGAYYYGVGKFKEHFGGKNFEIEDLKCPDTGEPLRAKVADPDGKAVSVAVYTKGVYPDRVEMQSSVAKPSTLYLTSDWQSATDRVPQGQPAFDSESGWLLATASKNLMEMCRSGDAQAALQDYRKHRSDGLAVEVHPDAASTSATVGDPSIKPKDSATTK